MSDDDDRILVHRLAAGELDAVEEERARVLIARKPELAVLLDELRDLQSRLGSAFPEPPPIRESRTFVGLMERLTSGAREPNIVTHAHPTERLLRARRSMERAPVRGVETGPSEDAVFAPLYAPPSSTGAHLFHLREIPGEDGLPIELEFYAGDVLAIHSEVLLLSSFAGSYHPTPGSVFGAIADRFGISFASGPPTDAVRHRNGLLHFRGISSPAFDSLWVIEMREPGRPFALEDLRGALATIGDQLPDMLIEASSITLPLLGTGHQRLEARDVTRELLSALPRWSRVPQLRTIRIFTLELAHIAALNRALDDRDFELTGSAWYQACRVLRARLDDREWPDPVRAALKDLLQIASAPDPSLQSVALEGRRIAEIAVGMLSRGESAERAASSAEPRSPAASPDSADADLQLLLERGRAAAAGEDVDVHDAVLIIRAALRAAGMVVGDGTL